MRFFIHPMIWTFALWFMFAVLTLLQSVVSFEPPYPVSHPVMILDPTDPAKDNINNWPYVKKPYELPHQSPVNIDTNAAENRYLPFLRTHGYWHFEKAIVNITNTGHTVCIKLTNDTQVVPYVKGGPLFKHIYEFEQMHFHWGKGDYGSEHEINGQKAAMEIHIVHYKKEYGSFENALNFDDGLCVIAFFGEVKKHDNPELTDFIADLKHIINPHSSTIRSFKNEFSWLKNTALRQHYFTYQGSLTTPQFNEVVTWIIFTETVSISRRQLDMFRSLRSEHNGAFITDNHRSIQPMNDRTVLYAF